MVLINYSTIEFILQKNQTINNTLIPGIFILSTDIIITFPSSNDRQNFITYFAAIYWGSILLYSGSAIAYGALQATLPILPIGGLLRGFTALENPPVYTNIINLTQRTLVDPIKIKLNGIVDTININYTNIGVINGNLETFMNATSSNIGNYATISILGNSTGGTDTVTPNGVTALVQPLILCLLKGTKILTPTGEVLIEDIKIGDIVITADNREVKVTNTYLNIANSDEHLYVIRKDIVSKGVPNEDLFLSGGHLVNINGKYYHPFHNKTNLIQKVNESKIVTFYHLVLENYLTDFLVANGLQVESCGDNNNPEHTTWDCSGDQCILIANKEKI